MLMNMLSLENTMLAFKYGEISDGKPVNVVVPFWNADTDVLFYEMRRGHNRNSQETILIKGRGILLYTARSRSSVR